MPTPADQRLLELLDKWLTSLELHARYASLDDAAYAKVQAWPEHQRPTRWIVDLARQKTAALRQQVEERIAQADPRFSDALEMMAFLANLVGSEHIERFIPVALPPQEGADAPTAEMPVASAAASAAATGTREMPKFVPGKRHAPAAAPVARAERKGHAETKRTPPSDAARDEVIADAARLMQWGRKWYELAELIARMADRPALTEVRRILKDNKSVIEKRAGRQ